MPEIAEVVLMLISLFLEADMAVGLHAVAVLDEQDEPFDEIPDEEGQVEQFALLDGVYALVVEFLPGQQTTREDEAAQADGKEVLAKQNPPDEINPMLLALLHLFCSANMKISENCGKGTFFPSCIKGKKAKTIRQATEKCVRLLVYKKKALSLSEKTVQRERKVNIH